MAINARNTKSIAAIFAANFRPSDVPFEIASRKLDPILSLGIFKSVLTVLVSGYNILEITILI